MHVRSKQSVCEGMGPAQGSGWLTRIICAAPISRRPPTPALAIWKASRSPSAHGPTIASKSGVHGPATKAKPFASELLKEALRHHQAGRLGEAERIYRRILATNPKHADSLHFLGVTAYQTGKLDSAVELIGKAISLRSREASYHSNLGNVLKAQGKFSEAIQSYKKAINLAPRHVDAHYNLGNALRAQGRLEEAAAQYRLVTEISPNHTLAHNNMGTALESLGKLDEAASEYAHAARLDPDYPDAHSNLGNVYRTQGRLDDAAAEYDRALILRSGSPGVHSNLGIVRQSQYRFDEAAEHFRRAVDLDPDAAEFHSNLGSVLQLQGKLDEAIRCHERALALNPSYAEAHNNLGLALELQGRIEEAQTCFDAALALKPDFAKARLNKALLELLSGDLPSGLLHYESRWEITPPRGFHQPQWRGEPLHGATILLHAEQGLGDTIQLLRYVPLVQIAGGTVVLEVRESQTRLAAQIPGIATVISSGEPLPHFDWHCPLMSLPLAMGTTLKTIPAHVPYLSVPPEASRKASAMPWSEAGLRVGIAWAGSPTHLRDWFRSINLSTLRPLLDLPGTTFYSLQKGPAATELAATENQIIDLGPHIEDMADTAAMIQRLDLVIGVDTSVVHLAGALGKPVWALLPLAPDWRWLRDREDSPWYPTMRLFRQPKLNDWPSVIHSVRIALTKFMEAFSRDLGSESPNPRLQTPPYA